MQVGIFAKTFPGKVPATVLQASAAAGYQGVAWNMACSGLDAMPEAISPQTIAAIVAASQASRQQIMSLSGTYNMIHPDPAIRAQGHARLEVLAAAAPAMGTRLITLCTGTRDPDDQWRDHPNNTTAEAWTDLIESFKIAVQIAEKYDIILGVEPELANVVNSASAAHRLLQDVPSDRIRIVLDPANLFETAPDPQPLIDLAITLLAPHIVMAHAKDRDSMGGFITAGKGVVNFPRFIRSLRDAGFDGPVVTHGLSADEAPETAQFLRSLL